MTHLIRFASWVGMESWRAAIVAVRKCARRYGGLKQDGWGTEARGKSGLQLREGLIEPPETGGGDGEFSTSGGEAGGGDTALWLAPPPPPKAQLTDPQNPTKTDRQAPEVTWTRNSAKKKMSGFRKIIICHVFGENVFNHFQGLKKIFGAFSTRVHSN